MQLALLLAETAATFVIVGGTARLLRGEPRTPTDLDVVVTAENAAQMAAAVTAFTLRRRPLQLTEASPRRALTSWSPVDVFVEGDLPAWHTIEIDGTKLRVADE